jgi:dsRNA-specific ribonuclease
MDTPTQKQKMASMNEITQGVRGHEFKKFISSLLAKGNMTRKYINELLDEKAMDLYSIAFTNPTADSVNNYEFLEKIGDTTCNKAIIWYIYRKFPKLKLKPQGLMIFTKICHILQSNKTFSKIALDLGFQKFITHGMMRTKDGLYEDIMIVKRNSVLEDCFEAFFGATEFLIDSISREGVGYAICNEIFKSMISNIELPSIQYENLVDAVTRLKELFDFTFPGKGKLGTYEFVSVESSGDETFKVKNVNVVWKSLSGVVKVIATGSGSLKDKAKIVAAENALEYFRQIGYVKEPLYNWRDFI